MKSIASAHLGKAFSLCFGYAPSSTSFKLRCQLREQGRIENKYDFAVAIMGDSNIGELLFDVGELAVPLNEASKFGQTVRVEVTYLWGVS